MRNFFLVFLGAVLLFQSSGTALASSDSNLLDRALEAAALTRDDVFMRLEGRTSLKGSPLFERWMASPLDAPAEGQQLAEHMLLRISDPYKWLSDMALLEGMDPPSLKAPPVPGRWSLPSSLSPGENNAVSGILDAVSTARQDLGEAFGTLTPSEIQLIEQRLYPAALTHSPEDDPVHDPDFVEETRKAIQAAERVDREAILRAGVMVARAAWAAVALLFGDEAFLTRPDPIQFRTALGDVRIGSAGPDVHEGPVLLIIDPGGDDLYLGRVASAGPEECSVLIDFKGNDVYTGEDLTQGAAVRGVGILMDLEGDDVYRAGNSAQGASVFGLGLLLDSQGSDHYIGDRFVQAAAAWGYAGLLDLEGDDLYRCASKGQAYTWLRGASCLVDACGDDRYLAGAGRPDPRESNMSQSFAQGFAMGFRNFCAGGTALLADGAGNDVYQSGYFGQGASYWMGTGMLYDRSGSDSYLARRYAQGAGIHLSFGMLLDRGGDDTTVSWGVSQGCGHDLGVGILINDSGNDTYVSDWLSLGASEANGIGIFADNRGNDGYETRAGAGVGRLIPARRSGGLGLFLDAEGQDRYSKRGANDYTWFSNRWGVGMDAEADGISGLNLPPVEDLDPACPVPAEERRSAEAARLTKALSEAQGLSPPARVEAVLSVAAHWGLEKDLPQKARKELSAMDPRISIPVLVRRLDTPDILEWIVMEEVLTVHAFHSLPLLEEKALVEDGPVRKRALYALSRLRDARTLPACLEGLEDPDPGIRAVAARAVGDILEQGRLEDLVLLKEALDHAHESRTTSPVEDHLTGRGAAGAALSVAARSVSMDYEAHERFSKSGASDPDGGDMREFVNFLFDQREPLKGVLVKWIQAVRHPEGAAHRLRILLEDPDPSVRSSAAYALGQLEDAAALERLPEFLRDDYAAVRDAASLSLAFYGDRAVGPVSRIMAPGDVRMCIMGLDILGRIGTQQARSVSAEYLGHADRVVRKAAEHALGLH
ncbi:MAG: HEAT repeat domain-containing protein [Thermodesulfobacteriota bacterium]